MGAYVWPVRNWSLSTLTEEQYSRWERDGFLVVPNIVPPEVSSAAAAAIRKFVGANDSDRASWYSNTLDIYANRTPDGSRPHHGPCGMVQMYHHASLWAIRQLPSVHGVFSDLYGTRALFVTTDRAHFKPPQDPAFPAWSDPGDVHAGLHWDVDTRRSSWPVPFSIQGVVYLEDTSAEQGALRVVPGFHRRFEWAAAAPASSIAERPTGEAAAALEAAATPLVGSAGSLVLWHVLLPHGPAPNLGSAPRVSAYVSMLPHDGAPFVGPAWPLDTPLGLGDAGMLAYLDRAEGEAPRVVRQPRARRVERWRLRLPLLDEDPREDELARRPPGEEAGAPAELTSLGRKLVGIDDWGEEEARLPPRRSRGGSQHEEL